MHILLTRPLEDSHELIIKFQRHGHKISHMPVVKIEKKDHENLNFSDYSNNLEYIDINNIALHDNHYWLAGNDGNIQILDENFNLVNVIDYTNFSSIRFYRRRKGNQKRIIPLIWLK